MENRKDIIENVETIEKEIADNTAKEVLKKYYNNLLFVNDDEVVEKIPATGILIRREDGIELKEDEPKALANLLSKTREDAIDKAIAATKKYKSQKAAGRYGSYDRNDSRRRGPGKWAQNKRSQDELREFRVRDEEFYNDYLKTVINRRRLAHTFFKNEEGQCFVRIRTTGVIFHKMVLRAQCEKEEKEEGYPPNVHVVSWEEAQGYMPFPLKKLLAHEGEYTFVLCKKDRKRLADMRERLGKEAADKEAGFTVDIEDEVESA